MLKFTRSETWPIGGYRFPIEQTKQLIKGDHFQHLLEKVRKHLTDNKLEIRSDLAEIVEDWLCRQCPPGYCHSTNPAESRDVHRATYFTSENVINYTIPFVTRSRREGIGAVAKPEATNRAMICMACPHNVPFPDCKGCRGITEILDNISLGNTDHDQKLSICSISGMALKIKVFLSIPLLAGMSESDARRLPDICWAKKGVLDEFANGHANHADGVRGAGVGGNQGRIFRHGGRKGLAGHGHWQRPSKKGCCGGSR